MAKCSCGNGHLTLMLWRLYLRSAREWKSLLLQIVLPALITFCFQLPGLTVDYRDVTPSSKTFASQSLLNPMAAFHVVVSSPVFPPNGNFDINYVPFNWTGTPMLLWAPDDDADAAAVMANLTQPPPPPPEPSDPTQPTGSDYFQMPTGLDVNILLLKRSQVRGFPSESALEEWYLANPGRVWAAVVFNKTKSADDSNSLSSWRYSIRINGSYTGTTKPALQTVDEQNFASVTRNESRKYLGTGAAMLQWTLDQSIARVASGSGSKGGIRSMAVPEDPQYEKNTGGGCGGGGGGGGVCVCDGLWCVGRRTGEGVCVLVHHLKQKLCLGSW